MVRASVYWPDPLNGSKCVASTAFPPQKSLGNRNIGIACYEIVRAVYRNPCPETISGNNYICRAGKVWVYVPMQANPISFYHSYHANG